MGGCISAPKTIDDLNEYIRDGHDVNRKWKYKPCVPLVFAVQSVEELRLLIEAKADLNIRSKGCDISFPPIHHHIRIGSDTKIISTLLAARADPNAEAYTSMFSLSPLGEAVQSGQPEAFKLLLDYGASPNLSMETYRQISGDYFIYGSLPTCLVEYLHEQQLIEFLSILFEHSNERVVINSGFRELLRNRKSWHSLTDADRLVICEIVRQICNYGVD
jgi:hypothetical protein